MKKFKLVLGVVLVLAIFGLLFFTGVGQPVGDFLSGQFGGVTSLFTGGNKGPAFSVNLKVNREALYGQSFKISNSTINLVGVPAYVKLDTQTLSLKESQVVNIAIHNFKGTFTVNKDGSLGIVGGTNYMEIDNFAFSSDTTKTINMNVGSNSLSIDNFNSDKISLASATGSVDRTTGQTIDSASFNGKLEMNYFVGGMTLTDTTADFLGGAASVKGDTFSFV
jgi:hypothetical protein